MGGGGWGVGGLKGEAALTLNIMAVLENTRTCMPGVKFT